MMVQGVGPGQGKRGLELGSGLAGVVTRKEGSGVDIAVTAAILSPLFDFDMLPWLAQIQIGPLETMAQQSW